jgi:catechol 2,3-dioxygenase-like lactoylglutathione lyase family enzyme
MANLPVDQQITFLYTENIQETAPFYEEFLGLQLVLDQGGCRIYQVVVGSAYIGICQRTARRIYDGVMFTIVTQNVDAWYERITSQGVVCEHAPRINEEYGIYHFFVKDPNGYLIEVQRFLDESWNQP